MKVNFIHLLASAAFTAVFAVAILPNLANAQTAAPAASEPAAAAPAAAAVAVATTPAKPEATENPYGIEALWKTSDAVAKSVLLLLLIMSISSWYGIM